MENITGIVLAGGEGKRMSQLNTATPKEMLPILGKPALSLILENIKEAGIKTIILVISKRKEAIIKNYFKEAWNGLKIEYAFQEAQNGPADAISKAIPLVNTKYFLVQYGDSLASINIAKELVEILNKNQDSSGILAIRKVDDPSRYGIIKFENNEIVDIIEKPKKEDAPSEFATMGTFILNTNKYKKAIKNAKYEYGKEYFPAKYLLNKKNKLQTYIFKGKRVDMGKPEDLFNASLLFSKSQIKCFAFDGDNTLYKTKEIAKEADMAAMQILSKKTKLQAEELYAVWTSLIEKEKIKESNNPKTRHRKHSYYLLCQNYKEDLTEEMYKAFEKCLIKNIHPTTDIETILKSIKGEKYLITEENRDMAIKKLNHLSLYKYFSGIVSSDDTKVMKPSARYYENITKKFKPEEILVIGDNFEKDLRIPAEHGMLILPILSEDDLQKLITFSKSNN